MDAIVAPTSLPFNAVELITGPPVRCQHFSFKKFPFICLLISHLTIIAGKRKDYCNILRRRSMAFDQRYGLRLCLLRI